eukprot:gene1286-1872_t
MAAAIHPDANALILFQVLKHLCMPSSAAADWVVFGEAYALDGKGAALEVNFFETDTDPKRKIADLFNACLEVARSATTMPNKEVKATFLDALDTALRYTAWYAPTCRATHVYRW